LKSIPKRFLFKNWGNILRYELKKHRKKVLFMIISEGNNPMVGATVACAVAVEEAMK